MGINLKLSTATLITCSVMIVGCSKDQNVYNDNLQEMAKAAFPVQNIDPDQTWNMMGTTTVNTTVDENYGESYTIKIYSSDPIGNTSAQLLSKSTVDNGKSVKQTFEYGTGDSTLYVSRVDSKSRREVLPISISNGGISNVVFSNSSISQSKSRTTTRAIGDFDDPSAVAKRDIPYTETQLENFCNSSDAIQITDGMNVAYWEIRDKNYNTFYISKSVNNISGLTSGDFRGKRIIVKSGGVWNISGSEGDVRDGVTVIVAKGGKINLNGKTLNSITKSGDAFIVMTGGEISGTGSSALTETDGGNLYNAGTVSLPSFNWTSNGNVYNSGNITISGDATFNTSTNFINYGTATFNGNINSPASGYIYNADGASLYGNTLSLTTNATLINRSSNCHFVNTVNSNDNANYKTSCKLVVDNDFIPNAVVISNGGSIQCKNIILHNSNITMGNTSILKAENTTFESFTVAGPTTGDYAVCVLGNISNSGYGPNCNFTGNIYVDITSNPWAAEANKYQFWQQKTDKYTNGAKEVGTGEAGIIIPSGDCSIGYTPTDKGGDDIDKAAVCTYGFEDMTTEAGDYDFNDVVLKVSKKDDTHYTVKLSAAGAIKKLAVRFNNGTTDVVVFDEVHSAFGVGSSDIVNTGNGTKDVAAVSKDVEVPSGFSLSKNGDFYIVDLSNDRTVHIPTFTSEFNKGDVPYALRVPTDWSYPTERTTVTDAYNNFATWAKDAKKSTDWYLTHVSGKVMVGK